MTLILCSLLRACDSRPARRRLCECYPSYEGMSCQRKPCLNVSSQSVSQSVNQSISQSVSQSISGCPAGCRAHARGFSRSHRMVCRESWVLLSLQFHLISSFCHYVCILPEFPLCLKSRCPLLILRLRARVLQYPVLPCFATMGYLYPTLPYLALPCPAPYLHATVYWDTLCSSAL